MMKKLKSKGSRSAHDNMKVREVMKEFMAGTLKTSAGKRVTDHKQAMAIALSEAKGESQDDRAVRRGTPPKKSEEPEEKKQKPIKAPFGGVAQSTPVLSNAAAGRDRAAAAQAQTGSIPRNMGGRVGTGFGMARFSKGGKVSGKAAR